MAHSYNYDYELETKICEISDYLGNLMVIEENHECSGPSTSSQALHNSKLSYVPSSAPALWPINANSTAVNSQYSLTNVTSALAARMNTFNSTFRSANSYPRTRKFSNHKQHEEKCSDTCDFDIKSTLEDLCLTPESFKNNDVYRLFALFDKLAFTINAEYIFENIYEGKTIPSTMNASAQIKHAVWSSGKLLRHLQDTLKQHIPFPADFQVSLGECEQTLDKLKKSILQLDAYKYCVLEHRKGKFVTDESQELVQPLINIFTEMIENVGKSRMYIQVIEWALKKRQEELQLAHVEDSCEEPSQPIKRAEASEETTKCRQGIARRYIG